MLRPQIKAYTITNIAISLRNKVCCFQFGEVMKYILLPTGVSLSFETSEVSLQN